MEKITESGYKEIIKDREISDIHFFGVNFSGEILSQKNFNDCVFEKCNLSNVKVTETTFNNVEFYNSKIMGIKFVEINELLSNFNFSDCKISLSSFFGLGLKGTSFKDSEIKETDFTSSNLEDVEFLYCDLEKSIFVNTNMKNTSFEGSYNFLIDPSKNHIEKTKFNRDNALGLLAGLDIIIE